MQTFPLRVGRGQEMENAGQEEAEKTDGCHRDCNMKIEKRPPSGGGQRASLLPRHRFDYICTEGRPEFPISFVQQQQQRLWVAGHSVRHPTTKSKDSASVTIRRGLCRKKTLLF